jgi:FtsZ-binding cell division protein ZapB
MNELIELRKLAEAATQGKRHYWVNKRAGGTHVQLSAGDNDLCCRIEIASTTQADIEFIAAANPAAVISLLDQIQALQAEATKYKNEYCTSHAALQLVKAERDALAAKLATLKADAERWKTVPMKYRRMEFNAQLQAERDALQAKLDEMEKQEPVGEVAPYPDVVDWYSYEPAHGTKLYTHPAAKGGQQ